MKVKVHQLVTGDVMKGSGEIVLCSPFITAKIPSDKMYVHLGNNDNQTKRLALWGKHTEVNIDRVTL